MCVYVFIIWCVADTCVFVSEEVMLAEEDKHAEEKSPLDGVWYKRKHNNPGQEYTRALSWLSQTT